MERLTGMRLLWLGCFAGLMLTQNTSAEVITNGDVTLLPMNPPFLVGDRLKVGKNGFGSVLINAGTLLESLSGTLGQESGSRGEVTVTGAGTTWDSTFGSLSLASMTIGRKGVGVLEVLEGGVLLSGHGRIAAKPEGSGEVRLDGMGTEWINTGISIGQESLGTLTITGGAVAASDGAGRIGDDAESEGRVTVSGEGSSWSNTSFLNVGHGGKGTLDILEGAMVENATAGVGAAAMTTGAVKVDGIGSTWNNSESVSVGRGGMGTLEVTRGGRVNSAGFVTLGVLEGSSGEVTIDGLGIAEDMDPADGMASAWEHDGDFLVGGAGRGVLNITGGGQVHNARGEVGFMPSGVGEVTVGGPGSAWSNSEDLFVGNTGEGTLKITFAGRVDASNVAVGFDGNGRVEVTGEDEMSGEHAFFEIRDNLALGGVPDDPPGTIPEGIADGIGEMLIAEHGRAEVGSLTVLGAGPQSEGTLTVTTRGKFEGNEGMIVALGVGSRGSLILEDEDTLVELHDDLHVAVGEDSEGSVTIAGGTLDMNGNDILRGQGTSHIRLLSGGRLRHVGRLGTNFNQLGGILAAGNSPGRMVIGGDYTLGEEATLELELAGLGGQAGENFDFYEVEGDALLAGTLSILADGNFTLSQAASFDFLTAASIDITGLTIDAPVGVTLGIFAGDNGGEVLRLTLLVPEPLSATLLLMGCLGLAGRKNICH